MKTGVIDVGGGLRGIYGAGVFDRCMKEGVSFDLGWMPRVVVATATGLVDRATPSPARGHTSRMTRQATRFLRMA